MIEWTDRTWNPIRGCSRVSEGCRNCYAERQAARFSRSASPMEIPGPFFDFATRTPAGPRWTGRVELIPSKLGEPLSWRRWARKFFDKHGRKPRCFVNSMSDLFHEKLSNEDIADVQGVMAACPEIDFQVLTKRPKRMVAWHGGYDWPLPNVWLGVSVEDQATADERIPLLLQTPAAVRFVSYEPALAGVDFTSVGEYDGRPLSALANHPCVDDEPDGVGIDWLIVGGESGPGARPCDVAWIMSAVEQCRAAGVPVFVKQLGARATFANTLEANWPDANWAAGETKQLALGLRDQRGADTAEWPEGLRAREFPR